MGLDEPSTFETLKEKITSSVAYQTGRGVVEWAMDKLWPVYSMGMIVAAVSLVGAVHEKQSLGDHLYGAVASEKIRDASQAAQNSLDDETTSLVRSEVFAWSRQKFRHEALNHDI